ncbi:MAG: AarF/ABC1/UbiB kinase family protein [Methanobacterium sp.]
MNLRQFDNRKPDFERLEEIIAVLAKYEFIDLLKKTGLKTSFSRIIRSKQFLDELDATAPERILLVFEELGTTFIKFGQILSTRPDIVGVDIANELAKLQDKVPPYPFELIKKEIEQELNSPLYEIFPEFEEEPVASASIAQVHRAKLKDGTLVAVKVQRPNIIDQIKKDITIMRYLGGLLERRISNFRYYNVSGVIDEFERAIIKELDFELEARNIEKFTSYFENNNKICTPKNYENYSTMKILTMEFIDGVKITEIHNSNIIADGKTIAKIGAECYFEQIFKYGFFHGDPHPGNLLVKNNNVLCFIDFGIMGHLDMDFVYNIAELFVYIFDYDLNGIINQLLYMEIIDDTVDIKGLKYDLIDILDEYYGADIKNLGGFINEFSTPDLMEKYKIELPKDFILLGKVLSILEDIGRELDPTFNTIEVTKPLIKKLLADRLNPLNILNYKTQYLFELQHIGRDLPRTISQTLLKAKKGQIGIDLNVESLDKFSIKLDKMVDRISIALIISSLIVGSSLILQSGRGIPIPQLGFSTIGSIIFIIASILAVILIINTLRR